MSFEQEAMDAVRAAQMCEGCPWGVDLFSAAQKLDSMTGETVETSTEELAYTSLRASVCHKILVANNAFARLSPVRKCDGVQRYDYSNDDTPVAGLLADMHEPLIGARCGLETRNTQRAISELGDIFRNSEDQ